MDIKVISLSLIHDYIIDWIELGQEDRTQKDMKIDIPHFPGLLIKSDLIVRPLYASYTVQYRIISSQ